MARRKPRTKRKPVRAARTTVAPVPPVMPPVPRAAFFNRALLLLAGVLLGVFGVSALSGPEPRWLQGVLFQALSLWFIVASFPKGASLPNPPVTAAPDPIRWYLPAVMGILVLLRVAGLTGTYTGWQIDEANNLVSALDFLDGRIKTPFAVTWWGNPSLPHFLTAIFFKVAGVSFFSGRLLSVLVSLVAVWYFHRWCRLHFDAEVSAGAALLFGASWWGLFYSLSTFHNVFTLLFTVGTFYHLDRALRDGGRGDAVGCGVFAAASVMSYISGRLVPAMVFVTSLGVLLVVRDGSFSRRAARLSLVVLAFLWFLGPFIVFGCHHPEEIFGRARELSVLNEVGRMGDWTLPLKTAGWTLLSFLHTTVAVDQRFGIPRTAMLDPVTGLLMAGGLFLLLKRPRSVLTWMVLPGFVFGVLANALAIQHQKPNPSYINAQRYFIILPFLVMAAARALDRWTALRKALLIVLLAIALAWNVKVYFFSFLKESGQYEQMGMKHVTCARLMAENHPARHVVVHWEMGASIQQFLARGRVPYTVQKDPLPMPLPYEATRDVALIFEPWKWTAEQARMKTLYPGATWTEVKDPFGRHFLEVVVIPRDEVLSRRAGSPVPLP